MTVRDIAEHLADIYGASVSPQTISHMTDRVMPLVVEWRNRPLMELYPIVYIDGIRYKVRDNGRIKTKCVYGVVGIDLDGYKDLLGLWIFDTESAQNWLKVLSDLKNRGVVDILVLCSDGLSGIEEACAAESVRDFVHKLAIVLKELRQSRIWIRLIIKANLLKKERRADLEDESTQLCNIIGKSIVTAKQNLGIS